MGNVLVLEAVHCNVLVISTVRLVPQKKGRRLPNLGPDARENRREQRPLIFTPSTILVQLGMDVVHSLIGQ